MLTNNTWVCPCDDGCTAYIGDRVRIESTFNRVIEGTIFDMDCTRIGIVPDDETYSVSIPWADIVNKTLLSRGNNEKKEMVSHPDHYQSETGLEAWDAIAAATFDLKGVEAFDTGNILKYMWRWKHKNGLEDLRKAKQYLEHLIAHVELLKKEND